ncbi:uncharacterized protein SPSC_00950 [Sporisorium scitamineum]|uniref:Uncharacterized protein n=1 Tax=Sporisorium scitamineum TaxID=49012 RepID=A0A0F7RRW2_9BASI|nr:hypothetical protein [Sporisorium scitamineum]CDU22320.1 uncharacterized protein SPSC_00950 [Sporisorium scitamineum]
MRKSDIESLLAPILPAGTRITGVVHLSELWAGYGHIYRIHVEHPSSSSSPTTADKTYIVKTIRPPRQKGGYDEGHARKMLSYQVEANFYRHYADKVASEDCCVPNLFASSITEEDTGAGQVGQTLVLEDLSIRFPVLTERRGTLNDAQVTKSLEWLAHFHASSWNIESSSTTHFCPPPSLAIDSAWNGSGLWQQGGYHYLATRQSELSSIDPHTDTWGQLGLHSASDLPLSVDWCLNNPADRSRLSLIHGDVKAANMAFSRDTSKMAMYDFQYVGIGLGVQDLVKFLTTSIPSRYLNNDDGELQLLRMYHSFSAAKLPKGARYEFEDLVKDWELALVSWVRFLAGWSGGFWGNVDWLQDRVEALLRDPEWVEGLRDRWKTSTQTQR